MLANRHACDTRTISGCTAWAPEHPSATRFSNLASSLATPASCPVQDIVGHQLQVAWTAVETPIEALVSAAIAPPPLPPGVAPGINPANLAALAGLVASEMGIVPGAMPGAMPGQMGAPVVASLPESLDEGVEAAGGVGGIKLTGQVRHRGGCCDACMLWMGQVAPLQPLCSRGGELLGSAAPCLFLLSTGNPCRPALCSRAWR